MEKNKSTQKILELNGRKFILIGTAHVSKASISEVENAIEDQKPDSESGKQKSRPGIHCDDGSHRISACILK